MHDIFQSTSFYREKHATLATNVETYVNQVWDHVEAPNALVFLLITKWLGAPYPTDPLQLHTCPTKSVLN